MIEHVSGDCGCQGQVCRNCKQLLCIGNYSPKAYSNGLGGWCITCYTDYRRRHYVSTKRRQELYRRDNGECVMCHARVWLTIDHILPVSKGGNSELSNLQLLCAGCHRKKNETDLGGR